MKNFRKFIIGILGVTLLSLGLLSCNNDDKSNTEQGSKHFVNKSNSTGSLKVETVNARNLKFNFTTDHYKYFFESNVIENQYISSKLVVTDINNIELYKTDYILDGNDSDYKLFQLDEVIRKANNTQTELNIDQLDIVKNEIKEMINVSIDELSDKNVEYMLYHLYYHNSIQNIFLRKKLNNGAPVETTLHPGYLTGITGFFCQEDFFIERNSLINIIERNPEVYEDVQSVSLYNYLLQSNESSIRYDNIYFKYYDKETFQASIQVLKGVAVEGYGWGKNCDGEKGCLLGCGGDWGCCSNYKGCCYFTHPICLIHDAICTDCQPKGWCGPKCKPDTATGQVGLVLSNY